MLKKVVKMNKLDKIKQLILLLMILFVILSLVFVSAFKSHEFGSIFIILAYTLMILYFNIKNLLHGNLVNKLVGISISTVLTSPFLVYSSILFIRIMRPLPNSLPIAVADSSTWILFAGSIISGSMVMLSLFFTLQYDKTIKYEERSIAIMPFIEVLLQEESNIIDGILGKLHFTIKNVSTNPVSNYSVKGYINHKRHCPGDDVKTHSGKCIINNSIEPNINVFGGNIIVPNQVVDILMDCLDDQDLDFLRSEKTHPLPNYIMLSISIHVLYEDVMKLKKYESKTSMSCNFILVENHEIRNLIPISYSSYLNLIDN